VTWQTEHMMLSESIGLEHFLQFDEKFLTK